MTSAPSKWKMAVIHAGLSVACVVTLYPVLYRMDDAGFVEPYWETQERAVPRKYYRITDSGKKHLHELEQQWWNFARAVSNIIPK